MDQAGEKPIVGFGELNKTVVGEDDDDDEGAE